MKLSDGLFLNCFREVARDYPEITADDLIVDNACMQLVMDPYQFDVLLLENLYGDIISDLGAGLVGGLGVVPGANIGEEIAVFEAVHGSAPNIAGRGIANPTALIQTAVLMLRHMESASTPLAFNRRSSEFWQRAQSSPGISADKHLRSNSLKRLLEHSELQLCDNREGTAVKGTMDYTVSRKPLFETGDDLVIAFVFEEDSPRDGFLGEVNQRSKGAVAEAFEAGEIDGSAGKWAVVPRDGNNSHRILIWGAGRREARSWATLRQAAGAAIRTASSRGAESATLWIDSSIKAGGVRALVEGSLLGSMNGDYYRSEGSKKKRFPGLVLLSTRQLLLTLIAKFKWGWFSVKRLTLRANWATSLPM